VVLLTSLLEGFLWGSTISVVNYIYLQWVIRKNAAQPPQKAAMAVLNAHFVRYFLNVGAMFLVYKHMWVLVGTAVGLLVMLKYAVIKQYIESRKHPYVSKRLRLAKRQQHGEDETLDKPEQPDREGQEK